MSRKNWVNILLLGLGFMLLFSAFQTTAFVQVHNYLSQDSSEPEVGCLFIACQLLWVGYMEVGYWYPKTTNCHESCVVL